VAVFSPSVRSALRFAVPLLAVLGLLAWGATLVVDATARAWFERDVSLRARLAVSGAREGLAAHVRSGDRRRLAALLEDIARDDRILAVEVCSAGLATLAATTGFPEEFGCSRVGPQARSPSGPGGFTWSPVERTAHLRGDSHAGGHDHASRHHSANEHDRTNQQPDRNSADPNPL
jgi:hypothetical protein